MGIATLFWWTLAVFLVGGSLLFGWALWCESGKRRIAIWQDIVVILAFLLLMISSAFLGLLAFGAFLTLFFDLHRDNWAWLMLLPGALLGPWSGKVVTQLLLNAARRIYGKPARELELSWWPGWKRRKKAAAGPAAEH